MTTSRTAVWRYASIGTENLRKLVCPTCPKGVVGTAALRDYVQRECCVAYKNDVQSVRCDAFHDNDTAHEGGTVEIDCGYAWPVFTNEQEELALLAHWRGEATKAWFTSPDSWNHPGQQLFIAGWVSALQMAAHKAAQEDADSGSSVTPLMKAAAYAERQIREVWTPESTYQKVHRGWALGLLHSALYKTDATKPRNCHEDLPDEIKEACETFLGDLWKDKLDAVILGFPVTFDAAVAELVADAVMTPIPKVEPMPGMPAANVFFKDRNPTTEPTPENVKLFDPDVLAKLSEAVVEPPSEGLAEQLLVQRWRVREAALARHKNATAGSYRELVEADIELIEAASLVAEALASRPEKRRRDDQLP